jgi:plasmid replication initiation protein
MSKYSDVYKNRVLQSNSITAAKDSYRLIERRLKYIIINQIHCYAMQLEKEGKEVSFDSNITLRIPTHTIVDVDENFTRAYGALRAMREKSLSIEDENKWLTVGFINYVEHDKLSHELEVEISVKILPYLLQLSRNFTQYSLNVALTFKSVYTQRFYEFCHQWKEKGFFFFKIDEIRDLFNLSDKYLTTKDLIKKTVKVAEFELRESFDNHLSEVCFTWEVDAGSKKGKSIQRLNFSVMTQDKDPLNLYSIADYQFLIRSALQRIFRTRLKYADRVISWVWINQEQAPKLYEKIQEKENKYTPQDLPRILKKIFKEDFGLS